MKNYVPCPKCNASDPQKVRFTWWGGALGPALLSQVKCQNCGYKYSGKTGKDISSGIVIYTVAVAVIAFLFVVVVVAVLSIAGGFKVH